MAFVLETGAGLSNATAYATVAEVDDYFSDRAITTWVGSDATKQAAIIKATAYIDVSYQFRGTIRLETQALSWPRGGVYDRNGRLIEENVVPFAIKAATAELALLSLGGDLVPVVTSSDRVTRVSAGSASVEFESGAQDTGPRYSYVDRLLSGLTSGGSGASRVPIRGW